MIPLIRKYLFAGAQKNSNAPQIFAILCLYSSIVSVYTGLFFGVEALIVRALLSVLMVAAYVALERSPLRGELTAFLSPAIIVAILIGGAVYFQGDFLLFVYTIGGAMISLTYLKPRAIAAYAAAVSALLAAILLIFRINLLGASFSMIHNYLYLATSAAMNVLIYIFCKSYARTLIALTAARNEAYLAAEAKGTFLSTMSHEIRTPMNAIIGMTNIGMSSGEIERKHYALVKIEDASTHLLGIINDVLDMSKIESGKFELSLEEFSFEKILQRVVGVVSFRIDEKKQKFMLHIDEDIPPVLIGDDQRLTQVIANLLGNAVKFTPVEGTVGLNVRLLREEDGDCTIQIEVTDSGIGISPEQKARLFQSFQQAETSTARKYGGTGLGLMISKNIVEMMGGTIWVESELEKGATFAFTVHMKYGDSRGRALMARETDWKNIRILAVDDNVGILGYMKKFVEGFGARCDTVICGRDALDMAQKNMYDICFLDWKMPDIDGFSLTKELRAIDPARKATIVIMIASADWSDIEESAKRAGVDKFLPKPLFPSAIAEIIDDFLGVIHQQMGAASAQVLFEGRRILLAEDIEINREIVLSLLEPTRITIDCAENGAEALRAFSESPEQYDAILMDVQMPEMDGYEATRRIRALELAKAKEIPIIAMTANVFREDIEKCLAAGMNDHIGKPIDLDEVQEKLRRYLPGAHT